MPVAAHLSPATPPRGARRTSQPISMSSERIGIAHTLDAEGFVLVAGKRVPKNTGAPLRHEASFDAPCQAACGAMVSNPLVVAVRFEPALGRKMYWMHPAPRAGRDFCAKCAARRAAA